MAMTPMMVSVAAALRPWGRRKADTPLEMASMPVSAVEPEEKACRTRNRPMEAVPTGSGEGTATCGHPPRHFTRPTPIRANIDTTNPYVGTANRSPDSRTPRRFASAMNTTKKIDSSTL